MERIEFYNKGDIGFDLESEEDCFKYFSSERSRDNIIMTGNIKYDDNNSKIIITIPIFALVVFIKNSSF